MLSSTGGVTLNKIKNKNKMKRRQQQKQQQLKNQPNKSNNNVQRLEMTSTQFSTRAEIQNCGRNIFVGLA